MPTWIAWLLGAAVLTGVLCWVVLTFLGAVVLLRTIRSAPLDSSVWVPCESAVCRQVETEHLVTSDGLVCTECRHLVIAV